MSLTPRAAAERLGVSGRTLTRYVSDGLLAPERTSGGHRRFDEVQVDRLKADLRAKRPPSPPPQPTELPPLHS